jgi:anti-sigma B factor antagonist
MDVSSTVDPTTGATVLRLTGQLDLDTARLLESALDRFRTQDVTRIVVDLRGLRFCDSVGLSAFLVAHRHCTAAGGYFRLAAPVPFLLGVLTVIGIAAVVPVYESVESACQGDPAGVIRTT